MTDEPVASALRQEGPQQEQQHDIRLMTDYQIVEVLKARAAHDANDEFGRWLGRLLTAWVTDSPLADIDVILSERAALSASRTAQAPQQEGGFVTSVRVMRRPSDDAFRFFTGGTIELLRLSRADAVRVALDILELADVPSSLQTDLAAAQAPQQELKLNTLTVPELRERAAEWRRWVCEGKSLVPTMHTWDASTYERLADAVAELQAAQARIQVLETSVDYLRYLVDHPVENKGGANQGQSTAKTPMIPDGLSENVNHLRGAQAQSSTADPPVAPAEGEALQREKGE